MLTSRSMSAPARRPSGPTIDTHAHWYPQEWIDLLARDGASQGAKLERTPTGYKISAGKLANAFSEEFVSIGLRLEGMKRQKVDMQALSLTTPMVYWAPPAFGLALSQAFNDAASAACRQRPDKFVAFAMVPMQDPALALKELERAAKLPGLRGLYLATSIDGTELDDKRFWDVYAKCEVPGLIGRLDHGTKVRAELKHMKRLPSEYLRRFTYDTIGHDDRINMNLVRQVGADRILLGSDYCFDMGLDDPVATVARLTQISPSERDLILGRTAAKLLRMD